MSGFQCYTRYRKEKNQMKYEWRKEAKALYQVKDRPTILQIPGQTYIVIDGKGDPN